MSKEDNELNELRRHIDTIDAEILALLNNRARLALQLGALKTRLGRSIHDPEREAALLVQLSQLNRGPLGEEAVKAVFDQILKITRELQLVQDKL